MASQNISPFSSMKNEDGVKKYTLTDTTDRILETRISG